MSVMSDSVPRPSFPTVRWSDTTATFEPIDDYTCSSEPRMVVVFAWHEGGFVLADIPGRGWCTPSGRIEPGETPLAAAIRETAEEIGALLDNPREIGRYILTDSKGVTLFVPTYIGAVQDYGAIPSGSESRGARRFAREELASHYWLWDDLIERVFAYAERELRRESGSTS